MKSNSIAERRQAGKALRKRHFRSSCDRHCGRLCSLVPRTQGILIVTVYTRLFHDAHLGLPNDRFAIDLGEDLNRFFSISAVY